MKFAELKTKSKVEMDKFLLECKSKMRQLRFDLIAGKVKNVREVRSLRKLIAQIQTLCQKNS